LLIFFFTIGDALVASLPASLIELQLASCRGVTAGARLDHVHALGRLHCIDTQLAPAALAACRERGCVVPAAHQLRGHMTYVGSFAVLCDGRLASGDYGGTVRLWDVAAADGRVTAVLRTGDVVRALAALPDGRRLAIGIAPWVRNTGCIEVWDVGGVVPVHRATINCRRGVLALAVLPDGRLAAGCADSAVRIVDVDAGAVTATLRGHTSVVSALAVLPDGMLASGSWDKTVRVWNVGARACVATLAGHSLEVRCLAVLPDGRLASVARSDAVRLWDVGTRTCVGELTGHTDWERSLAVLPDGRLAAGCRDGTVWLWDTRPAAAAAVSRAAGAAPVEVVGVFGVEVGALAALPNGRLACAGCTAATEPGLAYLLDVPPPAACE